MAVSPVKYFLTLNVIKAFKHRIMKKLSILFLLIFIAFSSCQKTDNSAISNEPTNYRVQNITDVIMGNGTTGPTMASLQYSVALVGSIQETVSLSLSGLPAGVYIDTANYYRTATTGIPPFSCTITLVNYNAVAGTYPIKLMCNGTVTGQKYYTFNLVVEPTPPCNASLSKTYYSCINYCLGSTYYTDVVTADASIGTRIHFSNFANSGQSIYADLNCSSGTLTIPAQTVGSATYTGSGRFYTSGYMSINFNNGTSACSMVMQ
jgi:hypothetical protein